MFRFPCLVTIAASLRVSCWKATETGQFLSDCGGRRDPPHPDGDPAPPMESETPSSRGAADAGTPSVPSKGMRPPPHGPSRRRPLPTVEGAASAPRRPAPGRWGVDLYLPRCRRPAWPFVRRRGSTESRPLNASRASFASSAQMKSDRKIDNDRSDRQLAGSCRQRPKIFSGISQPRELLQDGRWGWAQFGSTRASVATAPSGAEEGTDWVSASVPSRVPKASWGAVVSHRAMAPLTG